MSGIFRRGATYWARARRARREYRVSLQTGNRSVAERRFRRWLDELDATSWGDKPHRTFKAAVERFVNGHLRTIKPSSATRYGVSLKNLAEHFQAMTLDQITTSTMMEFETARRQMGVTGSTIRRDFACLSAIFASEIDGELIEDNANPVPSYLKRRAKRGLKESPPRTRYLTEAEEAALLPQAWPGLRDCMVVAIDTGLRREELFGLRWGQVDLSRGVIRTTTMTKNGRARMVPLPDRARTILGTAVRHLHHDFVFWNPETGTRYVQMNKGLEAAARRAGIADVNWHDLRRTAGCRWLQRDRRSMEEVSILLGHSSVAVTEKSYAFLDAETVALEIGAGTKTGTWNSGHNGNSGAKQ